MYVLLYSIGVILYNMKNEMELFLHIHYAIILHMPILTHISETNGCPPDLK